MPSSAQMQDRYGLPLTTSSARAAECFIEGLDLLLEQNFGPEEQFTQAIEADPEFALAQYAFAHHETGHIEEARRLAERSLVLRPTNAVAAHSVAHVCFETGDAASGGEFLESWLQGFDPRAPYHVHLSWHQALFELAR